MAIKPLNDVVTANYNINATLQSTASAAVHAGSCVTLDTSNISGAGGSASAPLLRLADRQNTGPVDQFFGFAADDASRVNNQFIQADPVGDTWVTVDGSGNYTGFIANNNGWFSSVKRAIGDFQDETVTNVTNLTAGASGYQGPGRGVGVFTTPSGQFLLDASVFVAVATSSTTADGSAHTFAPGDLLTFGSGATGSNSDGLNHSGKLVYLANVSHGPIVARVDRYDTNSSLLYITQIAV
jgi:hypothetical protein